MRRRELLPRIITALSTIALFGCIVGFSLAWFHTTDNVDFSDAIDGDSNGAYYASGNGSEHSPYEINKPIHLYNLAWLQFIGRYNQDKDSDEVFDDFYFEVTADLDMTGYTLPPIGTTTYPFVGNFNANDHIISNLTISNSFSDYGNRHPSEVTEFDDSTCKQPEIIGFFGVVGLLPSSYQSYSCTNASASSVTGLYLENIVVKNRSTSGTLAGFLSGYVNSTMTNCGVHYCNFDFVSSTTNISTISEKVSKYSYVGAINSDKYKIDGESTSGGGDAGTDYGTSTNITQLRNDLKELSSTYSSLKEGDNYVIPINYAFPFKRKNNTLITASGSTNVGVYSTGSTTTKKTVSNASTFEAASSGNIGYYVGSGIKTYYIQNVDYSLSNFGKPSLYGNNYFKIPNSDNDIFSYLNGTNSDGTKKGDYLLRMEDSLNASYWFTDAANYAYIQSANVGTYSGGLIVPAKCLWVAPTKAGTFKFVLYTPEKSTSIYFNILKRTTAKNYATPLDRYYLSLGEFPISGSTLYYFEKEVTEDDISNGEEYVVGYSGTSNPPYIAYMDIGANDGSSTPEPEDNREALTIDFVWAAKNSSGVIEMIRITDETTPYIKSEVFLAVETSSTTASRSYFYYKRIEPISNDQTTDFTSYVYYYQNAGGLSINDENTTSNHAKEQTSEDAVKNG